MKREIWLEEHSELFDQRKATVFADAKRLPDGSHGLCLLCVKDNDLTVHDTKFSSQVGSLMYRIPLKEISELNTSSFVLNRYLRFKYQGFTFAFADFGDAKRFLEVIAEEVTTTPEPTL